ncbi:adenylate/guanylate cyclase domain-containing protein [Congregibacter litoralis]|uniref:Adenylate cyclase, family 3 (Some protein containing HAMP domain protein) n=1 Tax=Congregibacter litoralis KT71 TaxID=314285 RepID=A4ADE9_9GAMM|nr:adenylate/guanylate cyclase domain-containing protein [Congregibacter litoralis]EAQ95947.1 Adenylate cyclase, family 3 (some protein containing HAMP domain protein) [Congregibacter litoralis KT71]
MNDDPQSTVSVPETAVQSVVSAHSIRVGLQSAVLEVTTLAATELPELNEEAKKDWAALTACAANIAPLLESETEDTHELRNLAGALRGYAEMLSEVVAQPGAALKSAIDRVMEGTAEPALSGTAADTGAVQQIAKITSDPGFILAVDDREENRALLARYLTRSGHFVVTAPSGEEALEMLANADVDVVLLDRMMPGMDGREVLRRIKAEPRLRATPVIMISGEQDMQGIIECIKAGADDYLFKPFNPVLLQARIKAGIERKQWHDREQLYRDQLERNERFIRATFGRYLSDDIVTEILERPEGLELGGDLREVTIMMSDIRGFTTMSEQLPPDRVVSMLNRYLGAMTDIILEYGGTIDEFLGDAILAVFGAPRRHDDDPDRAARCALAMQAAMEDINAANREDGLPELAMGIALNTGNVIAGNIGSERRSKYGFVGHAMNVTSRIEDIARRGEILIAESTRQALGAAYALGDSRELQAPGIDEVLLVHPLEQELP